MTASAAVNQLLSWHSIVLISALVGSLLPNLIAVLNQVHWPSWLKAIVAFAACCIAAVAVTAAKGTLTAQDWVGSAIVVFTVARASYAGLWKPTGVADKIETATSSNSLSTRS